MTSGASLVACGRAIRRFRWPLLLSGLGCVACCGVPLLAALGIGAGVTTLAAILEPLAGLLVGAAVVGAMVTAVRRRAELAAGDGGACAVDGSCGCQAAWPGPMETAEPGCTLEPDRMSQRLEDFRSLLRRELISRQPLEDGFVWTFRWSPATEIEVRTLAALEQSCCSFFDFSLTRDDDRLIWRASWPGSGRVLGAMLYRLSDDLGDGRKPARAPGPPAAPLA